MFHFEWAKKSLHATLFLSLATRQVHNSPLPATNEDDNHTNIFANVWQMANVKMHTKKNWIEYQKRQND